MFLCGKKCLCNQNPQWTSENSSWGFKVHSGAFDQRLKGADLHSVNTLHILFNMRAATGRRPAGTVCSTVCRSRHSQSSMEEPSHLSLVSSGWTLCAAAAHNKTVCPPFSSYAKRITCCLRNMNGKQMH